MNFGGKKDSELLKEKELKQGLKKLSQQQKRILKFLLLNYEERESRGDTISWGIEWRPCSWFEDATWRDGYNKAKGTNDCPISGANLVIDHYPTASDRASLSRSLKRLEERYLIERRNNIDRESSRTTHVKLTEVGREAAETVNK